MSDNVLESFVVALGFKLDEPAQKKMAAAIDTIAKNVGALTLTLEAAALAATYAVAKIAGSLNTLEYVSARVGSSAANIKSISYAFTQVGGSAQEATSVIEGFARATRNNPGLTKFVKDLGVDVKADKWDQVLGVVEKLQQKPYHIAAQQAEMLGIGEQSFNTMSKHLDALKHYRSERERIAKSVGLNDEEAGKASIALSRALGTLSVTLEVVGQAIAAKVMPQLTEMLKVISDWVERHPRELEEIVRAIGAFAIAFASAFVDIAKALAPVTETFARMVKQLGEGGQLETAMTAFAVFLTATWVPRILAAFGLIGGGWVGMLARLGLGIGAATAYSAASQGGPGNVDPATAGAVERSPMSLEGNEGWARKYARRAWNATKRAFGVEAKSSSASVPELPAGDHPILDLVTKAEGTKRGYNDSFNHQVAGTLTDKTLDEVRQIQKGMRGSSAIGKYQFMQRTLNGLRSELGLDGSEKFDAAMQDRLAMRLYQRRMKQAERAGGGRDATLLALAQEWASFPTASGSGYYPGQRASVTPDQVMAAVSGEKASKSAPALNFPKIPFGAGGFNPGSFDVAALTRGQPLGGSNSNDYSRSVTQTNHYDVKIDGGGDPAKAASIMERTATRMNQTSLRDVQSAAR